MTDPAIPGKRTTWNGIQVTVPASWHPAVILKDYLLFEDQYTPILELKWQKIQGRFTPEQILKKLNKRQPDMTFAAQTLPKAWQKKLKRFNHQGLQWNRGSKSGTALLLFCSHCSNVTLLQFHDTAAAKKSFYLDLLETLMDHPDNDHQQWEIFDIQADLPPSARLISQEFLPGRYTLTFAIADQQVTLLRYKPAAELLRRHSLQEFGTALAQGADLQPQSLPDTAFWMKESAPLQRLLARLQRKPPYRCLWLRHCTEHNVILGVTAEGPSPMPSRHLETICTRYKTV